MRWAGASASVTRRRLELIDPKLNLHQESRELVNPVSNASFLPTPTFLNEAGRRPWPPARGGWGTMLSASGLPLDPDEKLRQGLRMIEMAYEERTRNADQELHCAPQQARKPSTSIRPWNPQSVGDPN